MKSFIILLIKITIAQAVYASTLLWLTTLVTPNDNNTHSVVEIKGELLPTNIDINPNIYLGRVFYGDTSHLTIKLKRAKENQNIGDILTECRCTEYSIAYPPQGSDTITIDIRMHAVEYGRQIRRVHIYPSTNENCEAKSLTLVADVQ